VRQDASFNGTRATFYDCVYSSWVSIRRVAPAQLPAARGVLLRLQRKQRLRSSKYD